MIQIIFQFDKDKDTICEEIKDLIGLSRKYFPQHDEAYEKRIAELEEKVRQLEQLADNGTVMYADKSDVTASVCPDNSEQDSDTEGDKSDKSGIKQDEVGRATCHEMVRDVRYFKIDGSQTQDSSAPFCAEVDDRGFATFRFNVGKGAHREYSKCPEKMAMFCEINSSCDAPNHICNIKPGNKQR